MPAAVRRRMASAPPPCRRRSPPRSRPAARVPPPPWLPSPRPVRRLPQRHRRTQRHLRPPGRRRTRHARSFPVRPRKSRSPGCWPIRSPRPLRRRRRDLPLPARAGLPRPASPPAADGRRSGSGNNRGEFPRKPGSRGGRRHIQRTRPAGWALPEQPWRGRCSPSVAAWWMSRHRNLRGDYRPAPPRGFLPRVWHRSTYVWSCSPELRCAAGCRVRNSIHSRGKSRNMRAGRRPKRLAGTGFPIRPGVSCAGLTSAPAASGPKPQSDRVEETAVGVKTVIQSLAYGHRALFWSVTPLKSLPVEFLEPPGRLRSGNADG